MTQPNIILYGAEIVAPVRSVLMTSKALKVPLEFKIVSTLAGETKSEEFLKINPQHTVPTLYDNGFIIWDSHAIITYLANEYTPNSKFYPSDPKLRAVIDQRLHFDSGVLFPRFGALVGPIFYGTGATVDPELLAKVYEAYDFLETFLENSLWLAGDFPSLADISLVATFSTSNCAAPINQERYPKLIDWFKRCSDETWYEVNTAGVEEFSKRISSKIG